MSTKRLELDAARVVLGLLLSTDLPNAAARALEDGCDSTSLRILAGLTATEVEDARRIFDRALVELSVPKPTKRDAVMRLAQETAKLILIGTTEPFEGAKEIWDLSLHLSPENLSEFDTFVYAASEWEDRPDDRQIFEHGIVAAAADLVRHPRKRFT